MTLAPLTLIGPGRAGRALARAWTTAGGVLDAVLGRSADSARAGRELGARRAGVVGSFPVESPVLALAVPDDALADVAERLAPGARCRLAFHLSGALDSGVLAPLNCAGARVASLHPLRPFRGADGETLRGAFAAVEGEEEAAAQVEEIARQLGARPHRIARSSKPLYHAGATLAAGGTIALVSSAVRAWARAGLAEDVARTALSELAASAAAGAADRPFEDALTGPVARRDAGTVRAHVRALESQPDLLRLYVLLARETLERTPGRGREEELRAILAC